MLDIDAANRRDQVSMKKPSHLDDDQRPFTPAWILPN